MTTLYPWLVEPYQKITQAFIQGVGHHALLFKSEQGIGIEQLIHQVAHFLLCQEIESPCHHCHACKLFQAGNHPDFYRLESIEGKDIGVEQVREINEKLVQHAQQKGNKVVHIVNAERLTESAANALLKTLEEPHQNTYFLLQSNSNASLIATIYSRCQIWHIANPSLEIGQHWLETQTFPLTNEIEKTAQINTALLVNHHRPLQALDFLNQGLLEKRKTFLAQFWRFFNRRSPLELLPYFEKDIIFQQLDWLNSFWNDSLKAKLQIQQYWNTEDHRKAIEIFAGRNNLSTLLQGQKILQQLYQDLMQINGVNQELILVDALTKLIELN